MNKIYITTHKKFDVPKIDIYKPILAGALEHNINEFGSEYLLDNSFINISDRHYLYSEFTVLYWIWKNSKAEVVGENHYRRYFIKGSWLQYIKYLFIGKDFNKYIIDDLYIRNIFNKGYNCILPKKQAHFECNMKEFYCSVREDGKKLFDFIEKIIKTEYSDYLDDLYDMYNLKVNYFKCINVMKKELFDNMCKWLFDILFEVERTFKNIKERELAFLGEWLLNVWIIHNRNNNILKIKELFFINTDINFKTKKYSRYEVIYPIWFSFLDNFLFKNVFQNKIHKILNIIFVRLNSSEK